MRFPTNLLDEGAGLFQGGWMVPVRPCFLTFLISFLSVAIAFSADRPNLLIITVDDMNCDSVGAFGCPLKDTTPNIDRLASEGLRYYYAHVQTGSCNPSRNVLFSGLYSHNTGVEGFYKVPQASHPHLVDLMKQGGYFVGIRGKVTHSTPYQPYGWDADLTVLDGEKQPTKEPASYYRSVERGIDLARAVSKPFCLNINISDPHKPFYAMNSKGESMNDPNRPSRIFAPEEVPIPGFLFDHPEVRRELAHYYSSVRRADDCVGEVLRALAESGMADSTVVMFLSDHGMPFPFAKTGVWHHSTRTPLIVRWPGVAKAGAIDRSHMISAVDLLPTILSIAGIELPEKLDGHSFLETIRGESQPGRQYVYKFHNENSGRNRSPMRCVQGTRFGYHFNPWSDGQRVFKTATTGTLTFRVMKQRAAAGDAHLAERLHLFQHGVLEELYDYENDPDALHNLIDSPEHQEALSKMRRIMREQMSRSSDPLLAVFDQRLNARFRNRFIEDLQDEADARRLAERKKKVGAKGQPIIRDPSFFSWTLPKGVNPNDDMKVIIHHKLPLTLGSQKFHVTLKDHEGKRIKRIVKKASGLGSLEFSFRLPDNYPASAVRFATFVGEDYEHHRHHMNSDPVRVDR